VKTRFRGKKSGKKREPEKGMQGDTRGLSLLAEASTPAKKIARKGKKS